MLKFADKLVPGIAALAGAVALVLWLRGDPAAGFQPRIEENRPSAVPRTGAAVFGKLVKSDGTASDIPGFWPGFRGPNGDNICPESMASSLSREWPEAGPTPLWSAAMGEGYAGAAVSGGCVYVLDYDQEARADALRCLSLADGREIWRYTYEVEVRRNHGMSRTMPAVAGGLVVGLGPKCHVTCLDASSGMFKWGIDLVREYGTEVPQWYAGQCPLVDRGRVILAPAGPDVLLMAVDLATGRAEWKSPNPLKWRMTHSSVVPMELAGRRMYIYCGSGGVAGVSADDGSILWSTTEWKIGVATVPSPVVVGGGRIFLSGGYNAGSMMLQVKEEAGAFSAEVLFRLKPTVFGSDQQTPIFYGGHIYGVIPGGQLVCLSLDGRQVWASGHEHKFGLGPYLIAGGMIYVMNDSGVLTLAEASPEGYRQLARAKVLDGGDSWGPMALAGGRLIVRDLTRMVCLDVRSGK